MANKTAILAVRIIGDAKKAVAAVGDLANAAGKFGPKASDLFGKAGVDLADSVTGTLKKGVKLGMGAVAATGAVALAKGFQRLNSIDQAQAKLKGLGHDAESVDAIMNNALASVKGTAHGLGDAAATAASTVAAGVKPGKDLERTLKLTADAATIAGRDMGSMGSIINKVATADMMQMDVANQMMDAGIPIMQMVADEMGVTATEARKLASEGKVNFATFQNALEKGVGGAALEGGNTVQGAVDNMLAALGRLGASALGGIFDKLPGGFQSITAAIDKLGPVAEDIGVKVGAWVSTMVSQLMPVIRDIGTWVTGTLVPALVAMGTWINNNRAWLEPLAAGLVSAVAAITAIVQVIRAWSAVQAILNIVLAANPIGIVIVALAAFVGALVYAWNNVDGFRNAVLAAWEWIKTSTAAAWEWIKAATAATWQWLTVTVPAWVSSMVSAVVTWFQNLGSSISSAVSSAVSAVIGWFQNLGSSVSSAVSSMVSAVVSWFTNLATQASAKASELVTKVVEWFKGLPGKITGALSGAAGSLRTVGTQMIEGLIGGLKAMASRAVNAAKGVVDGAINGAKRLLGIASPSKVFTKFGRQTGEGFIKGLGLEETAVARAGAGLVGAAVPSRLPSLDARRRPGQATGGTTVNITINGALDRVGVAREIRSLMRELGVLEGATA